MKNGYNYVYRFGELTARSGEPCVTVDEELWLKRRTRGAEQILSSYPYGCGRREDSVVDSIREAFAALTETAREADIEVRQGFGRWNQNRWILTGGTLASGFVKDLAAKLAKLNRVSVIVPEAKQENSKMAIPESVRNAVAVESGEADK